MIEFATYHAKIVPQLSAELPGYPNQSIHANHIRICKFSDKYNKDYRKVVDVLKRWAKVLRAPEKAETADDVRVVSSAVNENADQGRRVQHTQRVLLSMTAPTMVCRRANKSTKVLH